MLSVNSCDGRAGPVTELCSVCLWTHNPDRELTCMGRWGMRPLYCTKQVSTIYFLFWVKTMFNITLNKPNYSPNAKRAYNREIGGFQVLCFLDFHCWFKVGMAHEKPERGVLEMTDNAGVAFTYFFFCCKVSHCGKHKFRCPFFLFLTLYFKSA